MDQQIIHWLQENRVRSLCFRTVVLLLVCTTAAGIKMMYASSSQASGQSKLKIALKNPLDVKVANPVSLETAAFYSTIEHSEKRTVTHEVTQTEPSVHRLLKPNILVQKGAGLLSIYDGDELVKSYEIITGKRSGPKRKAGDKKTPEGEFYVCVKNPQSRYYLSLGLSYPTPADADRGRRTGLIGKRSHEQIHTAHKLRRQPKWKTALGGSIMIHGETPGRSDTSGCMALLDNDQMQEIYDLIPLGTPVVIKP